MYLGSPCIVCSVSTSLRNTPQLEPRRLLLLSHIRHMRVYCDGENNRSRDFDGFTCFETPAPPRVKFFYVLCL
jgi:hypothetical protein